MRISDVSSYLPTVAALGMVSLFLLADHAGMSFFGGYVVSLLGIAGAMGWYVWRGAVFPSVLSVPPAPSGASVLPVPSGSAVPFVPPVPAGGWRAQCLVRLWCAFLCGVCLASTIGYRQQKEALFPYQLGDVDHIDAVLVEPSAVYPAFTILSLSLEAIHIGETVLSARGDLSCFSNAQVYLEARAKVRARVRITEAEAEGESEGEERRGGERRDEERRGGERRRKTPPSCSVIEIVDRAGDDTVAGRIAVLRGVMVDAIRAAFERFPRSVVPFLHALFLGERSNLNPKISMQFRAAGLTHLLALSGMHLGIITVLSTLLLRAVLGVRGARIGNIVLIVVYVWLIGNKPSLHRAAIMLIMWNAMLLINRQIIPINTLSYAFIVLVLRDPAVRASLSFQLSFAALAGIILLSAAVDRQLRHVVPKLLSQPLALTIAAQSTTLPLLLYHFGVWYPIGILSSLLITPLITLFMWSALLLMPLYYLPIAVLHVVVDRYMIIVYAIAQRGVYILSQFPAYQF